MEERDSKPFDGKNELKRWFYSLFLECKYGNSCQQIHYIHLLTKQNNVSIMHKTISCL